MATPFSVSGPMQPSQSGIGTTTSSAVAKGSHVDLTSSFQSIPLGRWFAIIAGPLPNDSFHDIQLWLDVYPQVVAICDELKTLVSSWATLCGVDIGTTTVEEPSGPSERFTDELNALLQGAPPCIKGGAERAHYGEFFLHYDTFPPLSGAAPPKAERLRHLDCVEFSTEWFLAHLARLWDHVDLPLCHMEMLIHAHKYCSLGAGFAVPMWPTEGPVDSVICRISRMARDDMGSILTPNPVADESFGFMKSSSIWHIKLDLGLDRPQYGVRVPKIGILRKEENCGDTSDVIHRGGQFSIDQIKWAHAKCEEFFAELDAKAKGVESKSRALYKKDHPNTDPSVSAQDYTVNMVQPAYAQLIESFRGEESPEWATEAVRLIAEHESAKVGATKLVAQSTGDIAWIMANQKDKWTHDMQWLATMDIHTMFLMVTGNAASPAAHAQNECCLGSEEMAAWYNSNFTMSTQLVNIYRFILSPHSRYAELNQFNEEQGKRKRDEDLSTMYKTRTAIKDTLIGLFSPFVKMTKFPWTNLTKVLVQNKLIISNFVLNNEFLNFGMSLSDLHTTDQYKTLYYVLEESSPEKKIVITKVDNWPVGEAEDVALITDRHGEVIFSLAAAQDYTAWHGAGETGGGEGSKGVKQSRMDTGLDDRRGNKTTVGKRKKAAVKSVALIQDELEDADWVDNLLSFGSRAASHDSSNSSSIPRSHSSLHNQQQLPNQPCPKPRFTSSLSVTTALPPVLNGLGHLGNVNINLGSGFLDQWTEEELDVVARQIGYQGFGDSSSMNLNGQPTYSGEQPGY
ncbi:hypothetical protein BS47DRAFT_1402342 [Hydnum rufescens UP504]|uniref:Uncharacterized protein n=1 Tax=Hydnum rufescens UP504 TaxID=1448309 RepID=A0A9P6AE26_9AGAM|nr:hypothetical protein BS47DRAFT_1402342 [Hydnum rufescens UP504]